jgi:FkbM family methyltransferase
MNAMNLTLEQYERLNPRCEVVHNGVRMTFATPSTFTKWRVDGIYTKEPCTIDWIETFQAGDLLFDVGANVGMYSIWAAATRGCRVISFEPEAGNYALLNRNILANGLQDLITAYCLGLSDRSGAFHLNMSDMRLGGSNHAVGEPLDYKHEPMNVTFKQGCVAFTLDQLVTSYKLPVPDHIKIDVDGIEPNIITGGAEVLRNSKVRSLLIEINLNLEDHRQMVEKLTGLGFKVDRQQVERAVRKEGPFKGVAEHVFRR